MSFSSPSSIVSHLCCSLKFGLVYNTAGLLGFETLLAALLLASVVSDVFEVLPRDKYPGDTITTTLSEHLAR